MKRFMTLTFALFCLLFSQLHAVNDYHELSGEQEVSDYPAFYEYSGTVTWYGDEAIALFYDPRLTEEGSFWIRENPHAITVTFSNNVVKASVTKEQWIALGCPNQINFSLFFGSYYTGNIQLRIPYPDN